MSELTLKNLTFRYKNTNQDVLSNVIFTFESGKLYAIVGPSGSGKSTLLSLMAGLLSPTEGEGARNSPSFSRRSISSRC